MEAPQTKTNFDDYAERYEQLHKESIKLSGFEPTYFDEHKIKAIVDDYKPNQVQIEKILNFGCGIGKSEQFINNYFKKCEIQSVDVSKESINMARERNKQFKNIQFTSFNDVADLPFENQFNIIFIANVFHHIPETLHLHILKRLRLFLAPEGVIYIFEHNPANPLTKKAFSDCEFDVGCTMIPSKTLKSLCEQASFKEIKVNYVLFFPKFLSFFNRFEKYMNFIPIGAQYYIKAKKNASHK
jgi:SAM-dependent methyltransferase